MSGSQSNGGAELWAVLRVLEDVPPTEGVIIVSDPKYVAFGMTKWLAF